MSTYKEHNSYYCMKCDGCVFYKKHTHSFPIRFKLLQQIDFTAAMKLVVLFGILAVATVAYAAPEQNEDAAIMDFNQLQQELEMISKNMEEMDENELAREAMLEYQQEVAKTQGWRVRIRISFDKKKMN